LAIIEELKSEDRNPKSEYRENAGANERHCPCNNLGEGRGAAEGREQEREGIVTKT